MVLHELDHMISPLGIRLLEYRANLSNYQLTAESINVVASNTCSSQSFVQHYLREKIKVHKSRMYENTEHNLQLQFNVLEFQPFSSHLVGIIYGNSPQDSCVDFSVDVKRKRGTSFTFIHLRSI